MRAPLLSLALGAILCGCASGAYGPSGDARLDSAVKEALGETKTAVDTAGLASKRCTGYAERLAKATNEDLEDNQRLGNFTELYKDFKGRRDAFELALKQNPDLEFASGTDEDGKPTTGQNFGQLMGECVDAMATIESEYDKYVRELSDMPVVTDVKGARRPRMNLSDLKSAIKLLEPADGADLLEKIAAAEASTGGSSGGGSAADVDDDEATKKVKGGKGKKKAR